MLRFWNSRSLVFKRWTFASYTLAMLLTSIVPMTTTKESTPLWATLDPSLQNLLHIPMFMGFVLLFRHSFPHAAGRTAYMALIFGSALAFGIFMEAVQIAIPGRYPSWGDMALNCLGTFLGMVIVLKSIRRRPHGDPHPGL